MANDFIIRVDPADEARLRAALSRVTLAGLDLSPALEQVGEFIQEKIVAAFESETSPKGEPWEPLAQRTQDAYIRPRSRGASASQKRRRRNLARQRRGPQHIGQAAQVPGWLLRSLRIIAGRHTLEVGEHIGGAGYRFEFGDEEIGDPRRPFVELTEEMEAKTSEVLLDYLNRQWF